MTAFKVFVILVAISTSAYAAPIPGSHGDDSEHHTIHVPYKVHTIHHHHVKKVPVIKEVVKEVPVIKETIKEVPVVKQVLIPIYKEIKIPVVIHHAHREQHVHHGDDGRYQGHGNHVNHVYHEENINQEEHGHHEEFVNHEEHGHQEEHGIQGHDSHQGWH